MIAIINIMNTTTAVVFLVVSVLSVGLTGTDGSVVITGTVFEPIKGGFDPGDVYIQYCPPLVDEV